MGNRQGLGVQLCSTENDLLTERFMVDKDFRIDYKSGMRNMERLPMQEKCFTQHQQRAACVNSQQQEPEDFVEVPVVKMEFPQTQKLQNVMEVQESQEKIFEGVFGNLILQANGTVQYMDGNGNKYKEKFDREGIRKTFPMGISLGGLTKSLWFKNTAERDTCYDDMTNVRNIANSQLINHSSGHEPECLEGEKKHENKKSIVFNGIHGNDVIVYMTNDVMYTDLDGRKHHVSYKMSKIKKCYPSGICFGGLPRTLWLDNEREREQCYIVMKNCCEEKNQLGNVETERVFEGLYGSVVLKPDYEVTFNTLRGDKLECSYDPRKVRKVFPMGISSVTFPSNIWFEDMADCERCFQSMKETC